MSTATNSPNDNRVAVRVGIIAGSGIAEALEDGLRPEATETVTPDTPFGSPGSPVLLGQYGATPIAVIQRHGIGHVIGPSQVPYRANLFALKAVGCTHVLATGACGSLQEHIHPGSLVFCDQFLDRTVHRPRTFYEHAAVHVEFDEPTCPVMRRWLRAAADPGREVHDGGTYVCIEGPSFSTRAESLVHRQWGGDVVGMTAMPEARLAREAEMAYALVALPTDYDCWRERPPGATKESLIREIIGHLAEARTAFFELLRAALADTAVLRADPSPAHAALDLGIWTDKTRIPDAEIERLRPLWGRHFDHAAATT